MPVVPNFSVDTKGAAVVMKWDAPKEKKKMKYKYAVYVAVSQFELLRGKMISSCVLYVRARELGSGEVT